MIYKKKADPGGSALVMYSAGDYNSGAGFMNGLPMAYL